MPSIPWLLLYFILRLIAKTCFLGQEVLAQLPVDPILLRIFTVLSINSTPSCTQT